MTDRYKSECASVKVRPIGKLLEQLEVRYGKNSVFVQPYLGTDEVCIIYIYRWGVQH